MRNEKNSLLGGLPKANAFSRRIMMLLVGVGCALGLLFLLLLNMSQTKEPDQKQAMPLIDDRAASDAIQEAMRAPVEHAKPVSVPDVNSAIRVDPAVMQSAANAPISVYHQGTEGAAVSVGDSMSASNVPVSNEASTDYQKQNQQNEKLNFLQEASQEDSNYVKSKWQFPVSRYEVKAGTLIPAILQTGINSDLPGTIIAKVRRDVFDTVSGNFLLIPQGSTLIGVYDSQVAYGQERVLVDWQRLIFPNGMSQNLLGQAGVDMSGQSGLQDQVNNHYMKIFGSAMMFSLLGAAGQLSQPAERGDQLSTQQVLYSAIGQQLSQTGAQLAARNMSIQPTLMIRAGENFNVMLTKDLVLPGPYHAR